MKRKSNSTFERNSVKAKTVSNGNGETGAAIVIALLIMVLLMGFVALAISRTTNEAIASGNDAAESRAFEASHACLEVMTRNFKKVFDVKLNADAADIANIESQVPPNFDEYTFDQKIIPTDEPRQVVMTGGTFQGLNSTRDEWKVSCSVTHKATGVQVVLDRRFYNDRIPIFQFGIFYDDNLEFHPGPKFDFGGRVHSNANLFLMAQDGLYFSSKVTARGQIFTDTGRNGNYTWSDKVYIKKANGTFQQLKKDDGSVLKNTVNGSPFVFEAPNDTDLPTVYENANWDTIQKSFQGNLKSEQPRLDLPIKLAGNNTGYVEMVKRGKEIGDLNSVDTDNDGDLDDIAVPVTATTKDPEVAQKERYYNKPGIRISLADSKAKLPGCADPSGSGAPISTACGVALNGTSLGASGQDPDGSRGYQPKPMADGYKSTRVNGNRLFAGRDVWIKVEAVGYNAVTNSIYSQDITEDILSLGVTERSPQWDNGALDLNKFRIIGDYDPAAPINNVTTLNLYGDNTAPERNQMDNRSVIKLQRFVFGNRQILGTAATSATNTSEMYITSDINRSGADYNYVLSGTRTLLPTPTINNIDFGRFVNSPGYVNPAPGFSGTMRFGDHWRHWKQAAVKNNVADKYWVSAFPINMFDSREGLYDAAIPTATVYPGGTVPWNGVMSLVDIDMKNLRRFLTGKEFDGDFPAGTKAASDLGHTLKSTDIPDANGWVLYLSDRRGDKDFDGEYDMEDVFGTTGTTAKGNDGVMQPGEDVNANGILERDYYNGTVGDFEAPKYWGSGANGLAPANNTACISTACATWDTAFVSPAVAATVEHKFYRRGFRLVNGTEIPGIYDSTTPANTKGFTVASENGVYVLGNYNATHIVGTSSPTPPEDYRPYNSSVHIPASIASDAVTILSTNWNDGQSFRTPFTSQTAGQTTVRFAMIAGDSRSSFAGTPNQGGGDIRLSGGVHNFKRFLENWGSVKMNYVGSIINLYNARNNNGTFKNATQVYSPPIRNWVFDATFLDPNRLPPGTPFFQTLQLTGFQRLN